MSFGLIRTNVGLTTNVKLVIDSNNKIYLESIDSNLELNKSKFKKRSINKDTLLSNAIPNFFDGLPNEISFFIDMNGDNSLSLADFSEQYDNSYHWGMRDITGNKDYLEDFEIFAPIFIEGDLPDSFIIFRIDDAGLLNIGLDNFKSEIFNKLKVVKVIEMSGGDLGDFLDKNFNDPNFKRSGLDFTFKKGEFSILRGIDYKLGGWVSKPLYLENFLEVEKSIYDFDKKIFDLWRDNGVIYPNILNISFIFNDIPSTPDTIREWSFNRYLGFWIDSKNLEDVLIPKKLPNVKDDIEIGPGNIIMEYPFIETLSGDKMYIEIDGEYYKIVEFLSNEISNFDIINVDFKETITGEGFLKRWKIISEIDLSDKKDYINKKFIEIDESGYLSGYDIENWNDNRKFLIQLGDKYQLIIKDDIGFKIFSDYKFISNGKEFKMISGSEEIVLDLENSFPKFKIFSINFSDIKDFDNLIVKNDFSNFEYEDMESEEVKNYIDISGDDIPTTSDYISNLETFRIIDGELTPLWDKNPKWVRWGYKGSLGFQDLYYNLNNNLLFDSWNKLPNLSLEYPKRSERNLDWFYTVYSDLDVEHSLHISEFDIVKYSYIDFDYFNYIFNSNLNFNSGLKTINKYSKFIFDGITNKTLFKGILFSIYSVDSISKFGNTIETINIKNTEEFSDWKFSITLSDNKFNIFGDKNYTWDYFVGTMNDGGYLKLFSNSLPKIGDLIEISGINKLVKVLGVGPNWFKVDHPYQYISDGTWKYKLVLTPISDYIEFKEYKSGDIINWYGILFRCLDDSEFDLDEDFELLESKFWTPGLTYSGVDWVYNIGEFWEINVDDFNPEIDFWDPFREYLKDDIVIFNGKYFKSKGDDNIKNVPINNKDFWDVIENWISFKVYGIDDIVIFNDKYFKSLVDNNSNVPTVGNSWEIENDIIGSKWIKVSLDKLEEKSNVYNLDNIIKIDDNLFYKENESHLNSNIDIYINKNFKNILINLSINDNTLFNELGYPDSTIDIKRDFLYNNLNSKFTSNNFINAINNLNDDYGFTINYYIIDGDDIKKFEKWELPYVIEIEYPDKLDIIKNSLSYEPINIDKNILSPKKSFIDIPISYNINNVDPKIDSINYNGQNLDIYEEVFRYSGYYSPQFYKIDLFDYFYIDRIDEFFEIQIVLDSEGFESEISINITKDDLSETKNLTINSNLDIVGIYETLINKLGEFDILKDLDLEFSILDSGDGKLLDLKVLSIKSSEKIKIKILYIDNE